MGLDHPEIEGYNAIEQVLRGGKPDRMLRLVGKSLFDCFRGLRCHRLEPRYCKGHARVLPEKQVRASREGILFCGP